MRSATTTSPPVAHDRAGDEFILGTDIPRALRMLTGKSCPFSARTIIRMGADDLIPLERSGRARWWEVRRRNLPDIADALGMLDPEPRSVEDDDRPADTPEEVGTSSAEARGKLRHPEGHRQVVGARAR
jgi:hypothetical protein